MDIELLRTNSSLSQWVAPDSLSSLIIFLKIGSRQFVKSHQNMNPGPGLGFYLCVTPRTSSDFCLWQKVEVSLALPPPKPGRMQAFASVLLPTKSSHPHQNMNPGLGLGFYLTQKLLQQRHNTAQVGVGFYPWCQNAMWVADFFDRFVQFVYGRVAGLFGKFCF